MSASKPGGPVGCPCAEGALSVWRKQSLGAGDEVHPLIHPRFRHCSHASTSTAMVIPTPQPPPVHISFRCRTTSSSANRRGVLLDRKRPLKTGGTNHQRSLFGIWYYTTCPTKGPLNRTTCFLLFEMASFGLSEVKHDQHLWN